MCLFFSPRGARACKFWRRIWGAGRWQKEFEGTVGRRVARKLRGRAPPAPTYRRRSSDRPVGSPSRTTPVRHQSGGDHPRTPQPVHGNRLADDPAAATAGPPTTAGRGPGATVRLGWKRVRRRCLLRGGGPPEALPRWGSPGYPGAVPVSSTAARTGPARGGRPLIGRRDPARPGFARLGGSTKTGVDCQKQKNKKPLRAVSAEWSLLAAYRLLSPSGSGAARAWAALGVRFGAGGRTASWCRQRQAVLGTPGGRLQATPGAAAAPAGGLLLGRTSNSRTAPEAGRLRRRAHRRRASTSMDFEGWRSCFEGPRVPRTTSVRAVSGPPTCCRPRTRATAEAGCAHRSRPGSPLRLPCTDRSAHRSHTIPPS